MFIDLQVRTSDAHREESITCEQEMLVEQVAGTFHRMARRMEGGELQGRRRECVAIADCSKRERGPLLIGQQELRAAAFGELA